MAKIGKKYPAVRSSLVYYTLFPYSHFLLITVKKDTPYLLVNLPGFFQVLEQFVIGSQDNAGLLIQ